MNIHMLFNATLSGMSGGDRRALEVLAYLSKNHMDCTVYAPQIFAQTICEFGIAPAKTVITSTKKSQSRNIILRYMIHTKRALRDIPKKSNGIIYYCTSAYLPDILPAIRGKKRNKGSKIVVPVFHIIEHYKTRPGGKINNIIAYYEQRYSLRLIKKHADSILVINTPVKEQLEKDGFDKNKIRLVDCGIDAPLINSSQPNTDAGGSYEAIYMGRLAPSKGIYDIAEIWSIVNKKLPEARLAIIGKGDEKTEANLKSLLDKYGLEGKVDILGFLESRDAYAYMKRAKVFIFPSHEEGWGIAIAEAMACHLTAVTYDLPAYKHIFNGINQEAPFGKTDKMAELAIELLSNEPKREKLAKEGHDLVFGRYTWDTIAANELKYLSELDNNNF